VTTLLHWAVSFLGRGRSERTATAQQVVARTALAQLGHPGPGGPDQVLRQNLHDAATRRDAGQLSGSAVPTPGSSAARRPG